MLDNENLALPLPSTTSLHMHRFAALKPGPHLIVLGAVHGNETCGTHGITRVIAELAAGTLELARGMLTLVPVTNPLAYLRGQRIGDRNLNRNLQPCETPQDYEDHIANLLCPLLAQHEILLDLHSFHTGGEPFAMIGPPNNTGTLEPFSRAAEEEAMLLRLGPRRMVEGWLDTYATGVQNRVQRCASGAYPPGLNTSPNAGIGTTEYMRSQGGYAITLECGQHADAQSPKVAYRAIRNTLAHLGLVDEAAPAPRTDVELLRLVEVIDREHAEDQFERAWASFDKVHEGELIGTRHSGEPVRAPGDGFIVFPNPNSLPGNEWFYFARPSTRSLRA